MIHRQAAALMPADLHPGLDIVQPVAALRNLQPQPLDLNWMQLSPLSGRCIQRLPPPSPAALAGLESPFGASAALAE